MNRYNMQNVLLAFIFVAATGVRATGATDFVEHKTAELGEKIAQNKILTAQQQAEEARKKLAYEKEQAALKLAREKAEADRNIADANNELEKGLIDEKVNATIQQVVEKGQEAKDNLDNRVPTTVEKAKDAGALVGAKVKDAGKKVGNSLTNAAAFVWAGVTGKLILDPLVPSLNGMHTNFTGKYTSKLNSITGMHVAQLAVLSAVIYGAKKAYDYFKNKEMELEWEEQNQFLLDQDNTDLSNSAAIVGNAAADTIETQVVVPFANAVENGVAAAVNTIENTVDAARAKAAYAAEEAKIKAARAAELIKQAADDLNNKK